MKTISISGPVAAGKTTLLTQLLDALGPRASAHEEQPGLNPFISLYYEDSVRWSFHSQISFLSLYFDDMTWAVPDKEFYFFDRCLTENLVIAKYRLLHGDLTQAEFDTIEKIAKGIAGLMPPVDLYLCLRCSPELLTERLRVRGRDYEKALGLAYSKELAALYEEWYRTLPAEKVLYVDEDKGIDLPEILRFLEKPLPAGNSHA